MMNEPLFIHHSSFIVNTMYVILVYDVAQERVAKVCKALRRRLTWVQNSVF